MTVLDDPRTLGRNRLSFADTADIDEFVDTLRRFEAGDISPAEWKSFRLVRGNYGQRQEGDVQMLRVKIPQGILTAGQLRALAYVAASHSRGFGHITTRQNLQFHFLRAAGLEPAMRRMAAAGLTTREACGNSVRNITACPYAGMAAGEVFDVRPYAEALTRHLLRHPMSSTLPRKFKIGFEGCRDGDHAGIAINDIGFRATGPDAGRPADTGAGERLPRHGSNNGGSSNDGGSNGSNKSGSNGSSSVGSNGRQGPGFRVTVGGGTSILPRSGAVLFACLPAGEILNLAEAIIRVFHRRGDREHRNRNRLKFLIREMGWSAWKSDVEETFAQVQAEGGLSLPFAPDRPPLEAAPGWLRPAAPALDDVKRKVAGFTTHGPGIHPEPSQSCGNGGSPAGGNSGSADGGNGSSDDGGKGGSGDGGNGRLRVLQDSLFSHWRSTNVRAQKQPRHLLVTVTLPLGDLTAPQMEVLADLSEAYGDGTARTTIDQNLVLPWVGRDQVGELYKRLAAAGLGRGNAGTLADVTSCPGAESCRLAVTQSRGVARLLTEEIHARPALVAAARGLNIKISGCPNGCGQHHIAGIGLQGSIRKVGERVVPQYFVMVGGGVDEDGAHFARLAAKVPARRVVEAVERLAIFYHGKRRAGEPASAFFTRIGPRRIGELLADLAAMAPEDAGPEDFIDLGETAQYRPMVLDGECSA